MSSTIASSKSQPVSLLNCWNKLATSLREKCALQRTNEIAQQHDKYYDTRSVVRIRTGPGELDCILQTEPRRVLLQLMHIVKPQHDATCQTSRCTFSQMAIPHYHRWRCVLDPLIDHEALGAVDHPPRSQPTVVPRPGSGRHFPCFQTVWEQESEKAAGMNKSKVRTVKDSLFRATAFESLVFQQAI
jgi:hypothetical protein